MMKTWSGAKLSFWQQSMAMANLAVEHFIPSLEHSKVKPTLKKDK